ncbi:MAG: hypothetical protein WD116_00375 [Chloroflexota bacterium]
MLACLLVVSACAAVDQSPSQDASSEASLIPAPLDLLDCDGAPSEMGGIGPFGIVSLGDSPAAALASWLKAPAFVVPINNWEPFAVAADRATFVYRNADRIKVVAVFSTAHTIPGEGVFTLDELRACPGAEFGATAVFATGDRVWTDDAGLILRDFPGAEHCGWQQARLLHIADRPEVRQYIGDPLGIMPRGTLHEPYNGDAALPDDATASGYRSGDLELWFVPDGRAVYVVGPDRVELWPRSDPPIACA